MDAILDVTTWIAGSIVVIGVVEWVKKLFEKFGRKLPTVLLHLIVPIVALGSGLALAVKANDFSNLYWDAGGVWATTFLGYNVILKNFKDKVKGMKG